MSKKHKKVSTTLYYIEHFFILDFIITECLSIFAFFSLLGVPIGIASSAMGLKICAITSGVKRHSSIIKKKKKQEKIVLLAKSKLNSIEVLTFKALINSSILHYEFVLINNVLKEYGNMKEEIKNLKTETVYRRF